MTAVTAPKSARRKSRELALQGVFEWLLSGSDAAAIEAFLSERYPTIKLDREHLELVLRGTIAAAPELDAVLQPCLDRPAVELSPVEHALLLLGAFELRSMPEIPYKVVINEAVDLAKVYGGTDGFKYVNGVLDRVAAQLRPQEAGGSRSPLPAAPSGPRPNPAASVPVSIKRAPAPAARSARPGRPERPARPSRPTRSKP